MLDLSRLWIKKSKEIALSAGATVSAEGIPMISSLENGVEVVSPSAGASGENFVGFSFSETMTPAVKVKVETITVPSSSPYTVTLSKNNLVGTQIHIEGMTEGTVADGVYAVNDATGIVTFNVAQAGVTVDATYRYYPTTQEVLMEDAVSIESQTATDFLRQIGIIMEAELHTDQFDASIDWTSATAVKLDAGILTDHTGSGVTIPVTIVAVPSVDSPWLGLRF